MNFSFKVIIIVIFTAPIFFISSCSNSDEPCTETTWFQDVDGDGLGNSSVSQSACDQPNGYVSNSDDDDDSGLPAIFSKFYNLTDIYVDGDQVVIRSKDLPDHGSPFYDESNNLYEAYNGTNENFSTTISIGGSSQDPDLLEQDLTFRIPINATEASNHQATSGGSIGIAVNGVSIFNQYNGGGSLLDDVELNNIDQYNGHPTPEMAGATYHYHLEPLWITANKGNDALIGVLLDGFFVYGPVEDGVRLTTADLDDYHGHVGPTADFPDGIYHYHITDDAPWINGDGYWGTPGTVTN